MNKQSDIEKLKEVTFQILNCGNEVGIMHQSVHAMYDMYCHFSEVDAFDQNDQPIELASGKAISPASAAHCLLEMVRTTKFLRGIYQAILDKLKSVPKVNILYAGCGPYATLIAPLLTQEYSRFLKNDLLDINDSSLVSAQKVIEGLGFDNCIGEYILADAADYKIQKEYDIIISETLNAALRNEPYVATDENTFEYRLHTTVKVYNDEILRDNECSLTIPYRLKQQVMPNNFAIKFGYNQVEHPVGLKLEIIQ